MNTLTELLESFPARDKLAVKFRGDFRTFSWSYRELYRDAKRFASVLREQGIAAGDRVAIWGPNSPEWAIAFFGIQAAGAVAVPIDLKAAPDHAGRIIASSGAKLAVKARFRPALACPSIAFEEMAPLLAKAPEACQPHPARPEDTAELVYTSGTTGNPKGVVISHANLMSNIGAVVRRIAVGEGDCLLSILPMSHLFEQTGGFLAPLQVGAGIVYLGTVKPAAIMAALKEEPITIMAAVPRLLFGLKNGIRQKFSGPKSRLLAWLMALAEKRDMGGRKRIFFFVHKKFNPHFRFFVTGGSRLDPDTEDFWETLGFTVLQGYGLTECSPILTVNSEGQRRRGSIGQALDNVELGIADDGELMAKGPNVFSGYYQDEAKTRNAFRNGWFLTGDIAERDAGGFYYVKGRKKDLIVTGAGVNVHPEDVEAVLNETPGIKESAVFGLPGDSGEAVAAALVPDRAGADLGALVEAANARLDQSQRVARHFLWPEPEFPKTATLKIKKNLVRERLSGQKAAQGAAGGLSPVAAIVRSVTGAAEGSLKPAAKLHADLGLDSIGRVELVSRLEQEFAFDLEEELITRTTTLAGLEAIVAQRAKLAVRAGFPRWPFSPGRRRRRARLQETVFLPLLGHWCAVEARGLSNLSGLDGPAILAPNHLSYLDQPIILAALPRHWRENLATAAWDEFFRPSPANPLLWLWKRALFYGAAAFGGVFGMSQTGNFKRTMRFAGSLADQGLSLLVFPEGERSWDGELLPLKKGVAMMAAALRLPVVPVRISGADRILRRGWKWPKKGRAKVVFGAPLEIGNLGYEEFLELLKKEIGKLS